jgi:hypothetical protein
MVGQQWTLWFQDLTNAVNAAYTPPSFSDTDAPNNSIYYSTTASKLSFKDSGGTSHTLY